MAKKRFEQLENKVQEALNIFTEKYKLDQNVEGILLAGSYAYGHPNKNSDLDIYIVYKKLDWRERGNTWINGYEIEYFINPEKQIYEYLRTEEPLHPHTAHMFANGIILYEKENTTTLNILIEESKRILSTIPQELTEYEIELEKYGIDDTLKDLEDLLIEENLFSYHILLGNFINHSIDLFCRKNQIIREKVKRLPNQLKKRDTTFYSLINKVFESNDDIHTIKALSRYLEDQIGGKRTKEWKLRGKCRFKEDKMNVN